MVGTQTDHLTMQKKSADQPYQPSEAELEILNFVWKLEPVAVRTLHERITATKDVGYTTVLKQVQRLVEKGVLEKEVSADGTHLYRAVVREQAVKQLLVDKMLHAAFGSSALQMMMHALGTQKASPEELQELKSWLDQQIAKP